MSTRSSSAAARDSLAGLRYVEMGEVGQRLRFRRFLELGFESISSVPELAAITQRYEQKYGGFMTEHAGPSYLAVRMLADAMEQCKCSDPVKVRDVLATYNDNKIGAFMQPGLVKIDGNGWNSVVHPVMIQWQEGKPRTIFPAEDASRPLQR